MYCFGNLTDKMMNYWRIQKEIRCVYAEVLRPFKTASENTERRTRYYCWEVW